MLITRRWITLTTCGLLLCSALSACQKKQSEQESVTDQGNKQWDRQRAESEYRLIQAELGLAKTKKVYLVINLQEKELQLKLEGAVVWSSPINVVQTDSLPLSKFEELFRTDEAQLIRPLSAKHLFTAMEKTPDSVLAIVGQVVRVDPELLQRDVPERFQMLWGSNLTLEVRTDINGKSKSPLKSTLVELRHVLRKSFGETYIIVKMEPDLALTLYRVAQPGLPTLFYPSM